MTFGHRTHGVLGLADAVFLTAAMIAMAGICAYATIESWREAETVAQYASPALMIFLFLLSMLLAFVSALEIYDHCRKRIKE